MRKLQRRGWLLPSILAFGVIVILVVGLWWFFGAGRKTADDAPLANVVVAVPTQVGSGAVFVAQGQQLFAKHRVALTIQPFAIGKQALEAVLQGKADLAVVADTPFMFAVMQDKKIATLSSIFGSRKTMAVAVRKDRGIVRPEDLAGKTVGTVFGTNAQFFLDTLLLAHSVDRASVKVKDLKPGSLVEALEAGQVDAVTVWHPELARIQSSLGSSVTTLYGEELFVYRFLLVGAPDWIAAHPAAVRQVLAALRDAVGAIKSDPAQNMAIIGQAIGLNPQLIAKSFDPNDFYLSLDQTLLLALGDQTRWAMKQGLVPNGPVPNYLDFIRETPLAAVQPEAVKIIH
jgi:ABC-type nitrate/sulfonate/bicarbonate transport system substrate-binding protein